MIFELSCIQPSWLVTSLSKEIPLLRLLSSRPLPSFIFLPDPLSNHIEHQVQHGTHKGRSHLKQPYKLAKLNKVAEEVCCMLIHERWGCPLITTATWDLSSSLGSMIALLVCSNVPCIIQVILAWGLLVLSYCSMTNPQGCGRCLVFCQYHVS